MTWIRKSDIIVILSSYVSYLCFPVLNHTGWFVKKYLWGRFIGVIFFFAHLYLLGYKQLYTFAIPCFRKDLYDLTHTMTSILHLVSKTLSELWKKHDKPTRSRRLRGWFGTPCWQMTQPIFFFIQHFHTQISRQRDRNSDSDNWQTS